MTHHKTTHVLARLETGFRTNAAHLKKLEKDLTTVIQRAREFGTEHGSAADWNTNWHRQWDSIEEILHRIRMLVSEMDGSIASSHQLGAETLGIDLSPGIWHTVVALTDRVVGLAA